MRPQVLSLTASHSSVLENDFLCLTKSDCFAPALSHSVITARDCTSLTNDRELCGLIGRDATAGRTRLPCNIRLRISVQLPAKKPLTSSMFAVTFAAAPFSKPAFCFCFHLKCQTAVDNLIYITSSTSLLT